MSILTDRLPSEVFVGGKKYKIKTDFKVWLEFDRILKSKKDYAQKLIEIIPLCLESGIRLDCRAEELLGELLNFYAYGRKRCQTKSSKKVLDYEQDAGFIYAAFYEQYGIDLCKADLHWHQFVALFSGLSESTALMQIVRIRGMDEGCVLPEKRTVLRKLKKFYELHNGHIKPMKDEELAEVFKDAF